MLSSGGAENAALNSYSPSLTLRTSRVGGWGPYSEYRKTNVVGTAHVIEACRRQNVPKLIYTSTPSVVHSGGDKLVDATYIDNAIDAHLLACDRLAPEAACAGRAYFIAQGEPMPARELINGVLAAADLPQVTKSLPTRVAWLAGATAEAVYRGLRIQKEPPLTRFAAVQLATAHRYDLGEARRDLGYAPAVSTSDGLRRLREHLAMSELND